MKTLEQTIKVNGQEYRVYSDYTKRGTFATSDKGETRMIKGSGYISNPTAIRKAIKAVFSNN